VGSAGRLVLGVAGAVVGSAFGPTGAQIGWAAGSALGGAIFPAPAQKVQGPRLGDLKVTGVEYGQPIPYVQGMMRVPGQVWWASDRREIAHTTTEDVGGKGGGQEVERTDYTYEVDILYGLTSNEIEGVTRIWLNGKLIWTNLEASFAASLSSELGGSLTESAASAALTASSNTSAWTRITVYTGSSSQTPDPTYEAAVGTANAVAYRGRGSVFIEGLQLGSSGVVPNLTFEVVTKASSGSVDATVKLQVPITDSTDTDISVYADTGVQSGTGFTLENGFMVLDFGPGESPVITYSGDQLDIGDNAAHTIEIFATWFNLTGAVQGGNLFRFGHDLTFTSVHFRGSFNNTAGTLDISPTLNPQGYVMPVGVETHVALVIPAGANPTVRLYAAGVMVLTGTMVNSSGASGGFCEIGSSDGLAVGAANYKLRGFRLSTGERYTGTDTVVQNFEPPTPPLPPPDSEATTLSPIAEDLSDVVSRLCVRSGLGVSQFDITSLQGSPQTTVRGMAITQVTSTRSVIEMLMQAHFFESHVSDKIYFVFRGGSSVETIDFEDMGATESDDLETFQLIQGNDIEFPAQVSLTYANWYDDYQNDTQESDRLVSAVERSVSSIQLPLALTPTEAKTIADKLVLDQYVSLVSSNVRLLGEYAHIEPTDIISPTDKDGVSYRMRVVEVMDNYPVLELQVVMDNATILTHIASTSSDYEPSLVVEEPPTSSIELMDIPILRDVDDEPGFYGAMKGSNASNWPGGSLFQSTVIDTDFSEIKLFQESAVFGTCDTTLGDWDSGRLFDWQNTVTVNVGEGTLSSSTRNAVLNDSSVNAMLIGSEIIQFITATLGSTGIYTLSGLLRGCRGTEWAMAGHASLERCVLLRNAGLRRIAMQSNELGSVRYYAGVTIGRTLSSGLTGSPAEGEAFTNTGRGLAPFNPVYLRFARETNGDITITGQRRSRLAVRMTGSLGINVPDDDTTSWLLDIQSNEGSPQTVYRTLTGSVSGAEITWTYSAANQATDFGSPTPTQISVGAYGYSSTVGRGEGKFKTGAV
jgi:hypothetical protein